MRLISAALLALIATSALFETVRSAEFDEPTRRYGHAILGDDIEWGALEITTDNSDQSGLTSDAVQRRWTYKIQLPLDHVFEDVAPRVVDLDGDDNPEVVVVETDVRKGAALAIYNTRGKIAETPHIGRTNRWLAPIGAADLDGDGHMEIAYVDRPHLAKTIRVWRYKNRQLEPVADLPGFTNHRIGEADIPGGIRNCDGTPEMIVATADWSRLTAVRFTEKGFQTKDIGPHRGRASFAKAMKC